jgi:hypothetical protein
MTFKVEEKDSLTCVERGQPCFGGQKIIFGGRYGTRLFIFLFLVELDICPQNLILTRGVEP